MASAVIALVAWVLGADTGIAVFTSLVIPLAVILVVLILCYNGWLSGKTVPRDHYLDYPGALGYHPTVTMEEINPRQVSSQEQFGRQARYYVDSVVHREGESLQVVEDDAPPLSGRSSPPAVLVLGPVVSQNHARNTANPGKGYYRVNGGLLLDVVRTRKVLVYRYKRLQFEDKKVRNSSESVDLATH